MDLSRQCQSRLTRGKYGVLGEKLAHSFSPQIHAMFADYEYRRYEIPRDEVGNFLLKGDFDGLNVTMPYKLAVIPYCSELSETARMIGSVNTLIKLKDGGLLGDNTDYFGFSYMLLKAAVELRGRKAIVLGDGGAAATVRAVLHDGAASEVVTISRSGSDNYHNIYRHYDAQIIINTTPVGMYPNNGTSPIGLEPFTACEAVLDLISNPVKTELVLQAEELGIRCVGGNYMLVAQAKLASELFLAERKAANSRCEENEEISAVGSRGFSAAHCRIIDYVTEEILKKVSNIALIGMPGCGKSSVGRMLASVTDREFIDVDELISAEAKMSIEQIFQRGGEAAFREIESDVLREASKKSGAIIATGGGIIKREVNLRCLKQNSVIVFIDRNTADLPISGRPLSASQGVEKLYEERYPLYEQWKDYKITALDNEGITAMAVKELLGL